MDNIAKGVGGSSGIGGDGAFERFLTAAIATIITIMFSWRLLEEGNEAEGSQHMSIPPQQAHRKHKSNPDQGGNVLGDQETNLGDETPSINGSEVNDSNRIRDNFENEFVPCSQAKALISSHSDLDCFDQQTADTVLPTWDEYRWEDDIDDEGVHSRRTVNDFVTSSESDKLEMSDTDDDEREPVKLLSVSERGVENYNLKYNTNDSGCVDVYPDESDDSDDSSSEDEHTYELQVSDSDSDYDDAGYFGGSVLEPIIEEDSDDFEYEIDSDEDNDDKMNESLDQCGDEGDQNVFDVYHSTEEKTSHTLHSSEPEQICENYSSEKEPDVFSKADDKLHSLDNEGVISNFNQFGEEIVEQLKSHKEGNDFCNIRLTQNVENTNENNIYVSNMTPLSATLVNPVGCLPPSPIRTCALDNFDDIYSDSESCSSESVLTVISVRSCDSDTRAHDFDEEENDSFIETPMIDRVLVQGSESKGNTSLLNMQRPGNFQNKNKPLMTDISLDSCTLKIPDSVIETVKEKEDSPDGEMEHSFPNDKTSDEEWDTIFPQKECTNNFMKNKSPVFNDSSSDSSDIQPREYDPDEDDFASFQHSDSDDDSFYLFVGNEGNLRKLDTIPNLKYIGRSPGYGDAWASSTIEETASGFSFSRIEDVSTNTRFRSYVVDRDSSREGSESSQRSDDEYEIQCEKVLDDPVECGDKQVQVQNMRNSQKTTIMDYDDAVASGSSCVSVTQVDGNIDFDRYIIKPACSEDESESEPDEQNIKNVLETVDDLIVDEVASLKDWNSNFRDINGVSCSSSYSTDGLVIKGLDQSPKGRHKGPETRHVANNCNLQAVEIKDKPDDENLLHHIDINEITVRTMENGAHISPTFKPYHQEENYIYKQNDIETVIQDRDNNEVDQQVNELDTDDLHSTADSDKEVEADHSESVSDEMESSHVNIIDGNEAPVYTLKLNKSLFSKQLEPACIQCSELDSQNTHELNGSGQELCIACTHEPCHARDRLQADQSVIGKGINEIYTSNKCSTTVTIKSLFVGENKYKSPTVCNNVADDLNSQSGDQIQSLNTRELNNLLLKEDLDNMDVGLEPKSVLKPVDSSIIAPYSDRQSLERLDKSTVLLEQCSGELKGSEGVHTNSVHSSNGKEQNEQNAELENIEQSIRNLQLSFGSNKGTVQTYFTPPGGRVIRTSSKRPSELRGVQRRIQRYHHPKEYTSVLLQPVTPEKSHYTFSEAEIVTPPSRLKINAQRNKFLSSENLPLNQSFDDLFNFHKTSLLDTPSSRRYLKKHERDRVSTESLPTDIAQTFDRMETSRGGRYTTVDISRLSQPSPRQHDHSFEKPEIHNIHADCIFSPRKKEEIQHTTKSLEDMFEELLRYDSVSSLATSGLKSNSFVSYEQFFDDTDINFLSFQYPLQRAASMSELGSKQRFFRRKRFVDKNVTKSKSLQTLETNLDEVFAKEDEIQGELKKAPSEHELRISQSLKKLHVPDWYKKSSFSRSDSTQSLFTYACRGSNSTLNSLSNTPSVTPSPCPTPGSNTVIIKTRVIPSTSTKLIRAPMLPTTPERSPISPVSPNAHLPSDRFRQKEKTKELKPIAIVPFAKIREMFELKSRSEPKQAEPDPSLSPTEKTPHKTLDWSRPVVHKNLKSNEEGATAPTSNEVSDVLATRLTVSTLNSGPNVVERKDNSSSNEVRKDKNDTGIGNAPPPLPSKSVGLAKQQRVHFSDEKPPVSNSQEQNSTAARYSSATSNKPQSQKTSLRFPFKFPASRLTSAVSQSKKGKVNATSISSGFNGMHALDNNIKTDAELLFEFLQKRRYSRILANGFAEQLDDLHVSTSDPGLSIGKHSIARSYANELDGIYGNDLHGIYESQFDCSENVKVMLSSFSNNLTDGVYQNQNLEITSPDSVLDRLLALKEQREALKRMQTNISEDTPSSPGSPPFQFYQSLDSVRNDNVFMDSNENVDFYNSAEGDYVLVKCENPNCKKETNLREAKHFYKTCHCCFTYYCSRNCRKEHWSDHKEVCIYSRINSRCKHVIRFINRNPDLQYHCSKLARRCYLSQGRGCIVFAFPDVEAAENFIIYGLKGLMVPPVFVSSKKILEAVIFGDHTSSLLQTCQQYNPDLKYAVHVAIVVPPDVPSLPVTRRKDMIIQKCAKLKLSPALLHQNSAEDTDEPSTLILTAVPGNKDIASHDRKARELCFINIQRKLRQRGVSLRHQFPHVYNKLIDFVSEAKHFSPMIIYPTDTLTQKTFMCVIMPESEPEIEWITPPDPLMNSLNENKN
ncbi:hypothetical protein ACJMK2_039478 [Sinanodonta woodiana]|uniref:MYND-type domain-containing protein n=1 Tax=Sinanodonta woodiana TaxID=1069815 RepID=A0ABD3WFI1_SINWO